MEKIIIATEYTTSPGAREADEGNFSGHDFLEKFLLPKFKFVL
jgi:hypothetical protein